MVNFAIIGCGKIGTRHINFLKSMDGVRIVGVCDILEDRAKEAALSSGAKQYLQYSEMLKDPNIDIVNVCTPSGLHAPISIDALNAGKHVLCEKPMALSVRNVN